MRDSGFRVSGLWGFVLFLGAKVLGFTVFVGVMLVIFSLCKQACFCTFGCSGLKGIGKKRSPKP